MKIFRTKIFSLICVFLVLSYFGPVRSGYGSDSEGDVDFPADQPDDPNCYITAVTTDPNTISQGLSLAGGANLYIQGSGFEGLDVFQNSVSINYKDFQCTLDELFTGDDQIVCVTPPLDKEISVKLGVKVKATKTCKCLTSNCGFSGSFAYTPTIEGMIPAAGNIGSEIKFYGIQRTTNQAYVDWLKIGGELCEFYYKDYIWGLNFDANSATTLPCDVPELAPGLYDVTQRNIPVGNALKLNNVPIYHHGFNRVYDFAILPKINSIGNNKGSPYGQQLTIRGTGFSSTGNNVVSLGDVPCDIVSQDSEQIVCNLRSTDPSTAVINRGFHAGLRHEYYQGATSISTIRTNNPTPLWTLFRPDAEFSFNTGNTFAQRLRGFFVPPVDGTYKFFAAGDDLVEVYLSSDKTAAHLNKVAFVSSATPYKFYWEQTGQISAGIQLTAGQEYYMEIYHLDYSGNDYASVGVLVPGTVSSTASQKYDVQSIKISCTTQYLVTKFTNKASKGTMKIWINFNDGTAKLTPALPWSATEAQIQTALANIGFTTTVTRSAGYPNGKDTWYDYTITWITATPSEDILADCSSGKDGNKCSPMQTVTHATGPVRGTFAITYKGVSKNFNYNDDPATFAERLRQLGYNPLIRVNRYGNVDTGAEWRVALVGDQDSTTKFVVDGGNLKGCANPGATIASSLIDDWQTGGNLFYDVIPFQMLKSVHTKLQVTVVSDGMLALCPKNTMCDYDFLTSNLPVIASQSYSGSTLTVTFTGAGIYNQADISEQFGGITCTVTSWTKATQTLVATCADPQFGTFNAKPYFAGVGFAGIASGVQPITIAPQIVAATPLEINPAGGNLLTITGTGFPVDLDAADATNFVVDIGGIPCDLQTVSTTTITCQTDGISSTSALNLMSGASSLSSFGGLSFLKNTPTATSVDKTVISPALQQDLTITGTNLQTANNVYLTNVDDDNYEYECMIKAAQTTSTKVVCTFFGGKTGEYALQVGTNFGFTLPLSVFVQVQINTVNPKIGSIFGGTDLTITGGVFSTDALQTLVYIGNEVTWVLCDVLTSSTNTVTCRTRHRDNSMAEVDQDVTIASRIVIESDPVCGAGGCKFGYRATSTPVINSITQVVVAVGDQITVTGSGFTGTSNPVVTLDGQNCPLVGSPTDTSLTFTVPSTVNPNLAARLLIRIPNKGYADDSTNGNFRTLQVQTVLTSISPTSGPNSGTLLTVTGKGFSAATIVKVGTTPCEIRSQSATSITCKSTVQGPVTVSDAVYSGVTCGALCTLGVNNVNYPQVTSIGGNVVSNAASFTITLSGANLNSGAASARLYHPTNSTIWFAHSSVGAYTTNLPISFTNIPAGEWTLELSVGTSFATVVSTTVSVPLTANPTSSSIVSSTFGGHAVTFTGSGFYPNQFKEQNVINFCGLPCTVTASTSTQVNCQTPYFMNDGSIYYFGRLLDTYVKNTTMKGYWSGDVQSQVNNVLDGSTGTYYSSGNTGCSITLDLPDGQLGNLQSIKFYPQINTVAADLVGTKFQGQGATGGWVDIATVTASVHDGWNTIVLSPSTNNRFIRYRMFGNGAKKKCGVAELQFVGQIMTTDTTDRTVFGAPAGVSCPAKFNITGKTQTIANQVQYTILSTPVVTSISPSVGTTAGGTTLTIAGLRFDAGVNTISVTIDGSACTLQAAVTTSQIICKTGASNPITDRNALYNEVVVLSGSFGYSQVTRSAFRYVDYWSHETTWGGLAPPIEGDSVHIPSGQTVLLDVSPPKLGAVVIEGGLLFDKQVNVKYNFNADYILINNGVFQVGTATDPQPENAPVTITLYGTKLSPSLPYFGNKVIGIRKGLLDLHGTLYANTWALLAEPGYVNYPYVSIDKLVTWPEASKIAIASTTRDNSQTEYRYAVNLENHPETGTTSITLDTPLTYNHFYGKETVDGVDINMAAEVVLLSRTITIQGDSSSDANQYGVQVMAYSPPDETTVVRIAYTEIAYAGQAYDYGRYALHLRQLGVLTQSYLIGNAIHHTYNKGIVLNGLSYLTVSNNVIAHTMGHAIYLEDGAEIQNVFEDNAVIDVNPSSSLQNTDQIPACFYITHPRNFFRRNRCGGSSAHGFWFDLKAHPTGASATTSICPRGEVLGDFADNVAHSCALDGFRLSNDYIPRTYPCGASNDTTLPDPYINNPSIQQTISGFTSWMNGRCGLLAENVGAVIFDNIRVSDNLRAGVEISVSNQSPPQTHKLTNSFIVGTSAGLGSDNTPYNAAKSRGLVTPRNDFFAVENVRFKGFMGASMTAIETCSRCENALSTDSGGRTTYFSGLKFANTARKVRFNVPYREILRDVDGTLTGSAPNPSTVTFSYPHLASQAGCTLDDANFNGLVCDQTVNLRRIIVYNPNYFYNFYGMDLRVLPLSSIWGDFPDAPLTSYSKITFRDYNFPMYHWVFVVNTGVTYKIHWAQGIDFDSFRFARGATWTTTDLSVVLKHNHTNYRETYTSARNAPNGAVTNINNQTTQWTASQMETSLNSGDWYHDVTNSILTFVMNGHVNGTVDITAWKCKDNCPIPVPEVPITYGSGPGKTYYWCDKDMWPTKVVPGPNDDVVIPPEWRVIVNCNVTIHTLVIHGVVTWATDIYELYMKSSNIWVQGQLVIGTPDARYESKARIVLTGDRDADELIVGTYYSASNKVLAVTGTLSLWGADVQTSSSPLIQSVAPGATVVAIADAVQGLWLPDHRVLISSSWANSQETEVRTIKTVSKISDNEYHIELDAPLTYNHFGGDASTIKNGIDKRSRIAWLWRPIIVEGEKLDNWGGRVYITQVKDYIKHIEYRGIASIDSVLFNFLGQGNTTQAGLTFENIELNDPTRLSSVTNCAMVDSEGWNVLFRDARGITVSNNVFYHSKQRGVVFEGDIEDITFTNNYVYASRNRTLALEQVSTDLYDITVGLMGMDGNFIDGNEISNNVVGACDESCIAFPGVDCTAANPTLFFHDNIAHSGLNGWLVGASGTSCNGINKFVGWGLQDGVITYFKASKVVADHITLADVQRGFILSTGSYTSVAHEVHIQNSHVIAVLQNTAAGHYAGRSSECSTGTAIYIPVATETAKDFPPLRNEIPWTNVRSNHNWQGSLFVDTVTFENYDNTVAQCQGNTIFRSNEYAADASASVFFSGISLVGSSTLNDPNIFHFADANPAWININDCGNWQCTGLKNIIVKDTDASLTGSHSTMIPKNAQAAVGCTVSNAMNGYTCPDLKWGLLTWESQDDDATTRIITPINVVSTGSNTDGFSNAINTYMDHLADGVNEGDLNRLSRFNSIVKTNKEYEIQYTGGLPNIMKFQLQAASDPTDYVIVTQRYTRPQVVEVVKQDGTVIKPNIPKPQNSVQPSDICGANVYMGVAQTVTFKLTGDPSCVLLTRVTNAVKGKVRYDIDINDFYNQDGPTHFIDRIVMVLGLDPSRIRVVNIIPGSTIVEFHVIGANQANGGATSGNDVTTELKNLVNQLNSAVNDGRMSILGAPVLDSDFQVSVKQQYSDDSEEEVVANSSPMLIILIAAAVAAGIVLIGAYFVFRRYQNIKNKVRPNIVNLTGKYNLAKASSQSDLFPNTVNDLKIEEAEPQSPMKSMISDVTSPMGESKVNLFARGKLGRSAIWDREDLTAKNIASEDL